MGEADMKTFHIGNSRVRLHQVLGQLANFLIKPTDDYELEIRKVSKSKTAKQRGTWHMLLTEWGKELGYTMPEMKNVAKRELMGTRWITVSGKNYEIFPSSEDEDKFGYAALIDGTLRLAAESGVLLEIKTRVPEWVDAPERRAA
jgi:hypothetical protein